PAHDPTTSRLSRRRRQLRDGHMVYRLIRDVRVVPGFRFTLLSLCSPARGCEGATVVFGSDSGVRWADGVRANIVLPSV
ncbi:MAG: hypothetical protein SGPRY_006302, partial [Prymnesium sp.]